MELVNVKAEADRLNAIIGNIRWSKGSRNDAITQLRALEKLAGLPLREDN